MWSSPQLRLLLSFALIMSAAASTAVTPNTSTINGSELISVINEPYTNSNKNPMPTEALKPSTFDSEVLIDEVTIGEVLVQLTRHCESQSRAAIGAALAKITIQLDTMQQSVVSMNQSMVALSGQHKSLQQSSNLWSSDQQVVIYSVDSMNKSVVSLASDQQILQESVASLANKQQTVLETVLQSIANVANQQQTVLQSISSLVTHQQSQQASVGALQEDVGSLSDQHAALQESARSSHAELTEQLRVLGTAVSLLPGRQLGDPCRNSTDCTRSVAFSQCGTDGVCVCTAGFRQAAGSNTRCQPHRLVGESCTADSDCLTAVANSACGATGVCTCSAGRWNRGNTECRPTASQGQRCEYNNDCSHADIHTTCEGSVCQCASVRVGSYEYRLRDGGSCDRGRVELRRQSGSWGFVCDDHWDNKDAGVVCRSLKYRHGTAHNKSKFGGSDHFHMDDVKCVGTESSLLECPYAGWGSENCSNKEVAGVTCRM